MKKNIHPAFQKVVFEDTTSGEKFLIGSTIKSKETIKWEDGNEYPLIKVEISSASHPFYTGKQTLVDTAGRVDKFLAKQKKADATTVKKKKKKKSIVEYINVDNQFEEIQSLKKKIEKSTDDKLTKKVEKAEKKEESAEENSDQ